MTIYTNTNKVAESLFSLVDVNVEVEPFRKWPTCRDVFIVDERFEDLISDYNQVLHENTSPSDETRLGRFSWNNGQKLFHIRVQQTMV